MTTTSNKYSKTLIATLSILFFVGFSAAAAATFDADNAFEEIGTDASFSISGETDNPNNAVVGFTSSTESAKSSSEDFSKDTSSSGTQTVTISNTPIADTNSDGEIDSNDVSVSATDADVSISSVNPKTGDVTYNVDTTGGSGDTVTVDYDYYPEANTGIDVSSGTATTTVPTADSGVSEDGTVQASDGDTITAYYWDSSENTYRTATTEADANPTFSSASVSDDTPTEVDVTFSEDVSLTSGTNTDGFSVSGTTGTVDTASVSGNTVTLTLSSSVLSTDGDFSVSYDGTTNGNVKDADEGSFEAATFTSNTVTNNVDKPSFDSATISDNAEITVNFDEAVDASDATGFSISGQSTSASVSGLSGGTVSDSTSITLSLSENPASDDTITLDYTGSGAVTDADANDENANSFNQEITNNVDNTDQNVVNSDTSKDWGAGGDTVTVQEITVEDTDDDGVDTTVNQFSITNDGTATPSDVDSITIEDSSQNTVATVNTVDSLSDLTVDSLSENVVADSGSDSTTSETFTIKATLASSPTDANTLEFTTDVQVTEDAEGRTLTADDTTADEIDLTPEIKGATTADKDNNGQIDQVKVDFSEAVNVGSASDGVTGLSIGAADEYTIDGLDSSNDQSSLTFSVAESGSSDTGATPDVEYNTGSSELTDSDQQNKEIAAHGPTAATDGAAPVATSASYTDSGSDGTVDQADVTFSEEISYGSYSDGDWSVTTNDFSTFEVTGKSSVGTSTVTLDISADSEVTGVSSEPQIDIASEGVVTATSGSNTAADTRSTPLTMTDNAAPVITLATTYDVDNDGDVGAATLTASEAMDGNLGTASDYEIGGTDASTVDAVEYTDDSGTTNDGSNAKFRVELADNSEIEGTDAKQVNYDGSSATDGNGNNLVELTDGDVTETDEADPVVGFSDGFNMVSFPSRVGVYDLGTLLDDSDNVNSGNIEAIWSYENGEWKSYSPDRSSNPLSEVEGGQGYILEASGSGKIVADVDQEKEGYNQLSGVSLDKSRWNLVGHYAESSASVSDDVPALSNGAGEQVVQVNPFTQKSTLNPGEAYWVESASDDLYGPVA